jgi:hypothetical protein
MTEQAVTEKQQENTIPDSFTPSYQTIGLGMAAAAAATLWGYSRLSKPPSVAPEPQKEPKKHADILASCTTTFFNPEHPMYKNMEEIQTRIYDTDKWQLKQFTDTVKLVVAFENLMVSCESKRHSETVLYPEKAFNIQRNFMDKIRLIAQAQRKDDTCVRANVVMEFAELVNSWMTDNIGNLNNMNDEKVARSIIGA